MNPAQEKGQRAYSETADPAAYVPREATEAVLDMLGDWLRGDGVGSTLFAVVAGPGVGKTFLLRVIESRLQSLRGPGLDGAEGKPRSLYLPYASLSPVDLCVWAYGLLGREPGLSDGEERSEEAIAAMLDLADSPSNPFYLIIDDADSMPAETVRALAQALPRKGSPLRILLAMNDDAKASRMLAALDTLDPTVIMLRGGMSEKETALFIQARMRWAGLGAREVGAFDARIVSQIFAQSGGVARDVLRAAAQVYDERFVQSMR